MNHQQQQQQQQRNFNQQPGFPPQQHQHQNQPYTQLESFGGPPQGLGFENHPQNTNGRHQQQPPASMAVVTDSSSGVLGDNRLSSGNGWGPLTNANNPLSPSSSTPNPMASAVCTNNNSNNQTFSHQGSYPDPTGGPLVGGGELQEMPGTALGSLSGGADTTLAAVVVPGLGGVGAPLVTAPTETKEWKVYFDKANQMNYWHNGEESVSFESRSL